MRAADGLPAEYRGVLDQFDVVNRTLSEASVYEALSLQLRTEGTDWDKIGYQLRAEIMLGAFSEHYSDQPTSLGVSYFGPLSERIDSEGNRLSFPNLSDITPEVLGYWGARADEAFNLVLRARYADLVWEFTRKVTAKGGDVRFARLACDGYIEVIERRAYKHDCEALEKVKRALQLAAQVNDKARVDRTVTAIFALERRLAERESNWQRLGLAFDLLLDNKKIELPEAVREQLIREQEMLIVEVAASMSSSEMKDPFAAEASALRLAAYYRKHNRLEDARTALRAYGAIFRSLAREADGFVGTVWLQKVYEVYKEYGMSADAEQIAVDLREVGKKTQAGMKTLSHSFEFPRKEMDEFMEELIKGELGDALNNIRWHFTPRLDQIRQQVEELAKAAPLAALLGQRIVDDKGRVLAKVGSVNDELEGRVTLQLIQNIGVVAPFLNEAIQRLRESFKLAAAQVVEQLYQSPLFEENRRECLEKAIQSYFDGDYLVAVHLLVPQIEYGFRRIVELAGGSTFRMGRQGGLVLKNLDDILRGPFVQEALGKDFVRYALAFLTDQSGPNLRNNVAHGIIDPTEVGLMHADRVFHLILCLGGLRAEGSEDERSEEGGSEPAE